MDAHHARGTSAPTRAGRLILRVLTLLLAGTALLLGLAAPASAATIDCTPMGEPSCRTLVPVIECVWTESNGSRTVVWGYNNPSGDSLHIDVGNKNAMSPGVENQGQPTEFLPGRALNAFTTTVAAGETASWRLGNSTASLSSSTPACVTKPVSQVGNLFALALYVIAIAAAVPVAVRPRRTLVSAMSRGAVR